MDNQHIEEIVTAFHRQMAHAFSRQLSQDEMITFRKAEHAYDEVLKPLNKKTINIFVDKGRTAFAAEKRNIENKMQSQVA